MTIWDKLLTTPSAEDAATAEVVMTMVLIWLSMNLPANPLWFIAATPQKSRSHYDNFMTGQE